MSSLTNKKIGITSGAFDLFHPGHVLMLKEAKAQCDYLFVALQTDPNVDRPEKNRPIQSIEERYIQLIGCRYVDCVLIYTTEAELLALMDAINPDVRIVGMDHKDKPFTGDDQGIPVFFNSRDHSYSSSELRERICTAWQKDVISGRTFEFPKEMFVMDTLNPHQHELVTAPSAVKIFVKKPYKVTLGKIKKRK